MKKRSMTASELLRELENDSAYQEEMRKKETADREKFARSLKEIDPLLSELKLLGIDVKDIWELRSSEKAYPEAIPTLVKYVDVPSLSPLNREAIVRAIAVPEARGIGNKKLIKLYKEATDRSLKDAIAMALEYNAVAEDADAIRALLSDSSHGEKRAFLLEAIAAVEGKNAIPLLMNFASDQSNNIYNVAIAVLGNLRAIEAEDVIRTYLDAPQSWVRKEARKALSKIETAKKRLKKQGKCDA